MKKSFDLLIVGAGPVGCVIAERAAARGWTSLLTDRRDHIAGNCYDTFHPSGVLIHRYGPHYFRSNNEKLVTYLSRFTKWIPGNYVVKSEFQGTLYPFPINLTTLEQFFKKRFTSAKARLFLESKREKISSIRNSEEYVLSRVGQELYQAFYLNYTLKQWGKHPRELDASVCGRIPVRFNRNPYYVDHLKRLTPKEGFTRMFENMIAHPNISVRLGVDYRKLRRTLHPRIATVYCGPLDDYFDFQWGRLPWRSLEFQFKVRKKEFVQPCVQINYPNEFAYTRSVEIKHVTRQIHPHTVVSYEYPRSSGEPYYPIPNPATNQLFKLYQDRATIETRRKKVFFAGRLAEYKYMNTDEAIESALRVFEDIVSRTKADA